MASPWTTVGTLHLSGAREERGVGVGVGVTMAVLLCAILPIVSSLLLLHVTGRIGSTFLQSYLIGLPSPDWLMVHSMPQHHPTQSIHLCLRTPMQSV